MSTGGGGESTKGNAVMSGDGSSCVGSGGVCESNCCRFPGVIQELWEDITYSFPFFIDFFFNKVVPLVGMERKRLGRCL